MMEQIELRNKQFMERVEQISREGAPGKARLHPRTAVHRALHSPAPSFYISREHAWKKLAERKKFIPPGEKAHRRRMWEEMEQAYETRRRERPREEPLLSLDHVLAHHHPSRFFISEDYAWKLALKLSKTSRAKPKQ